MLRNLLEGAMRLRLLSTIAGMVLTLFGAIPPRPAHAFIEYVNPTPLIFADTPIGSTSTLDVLLFIDQDILSIVSAEQISITPQFTVSPLNCLGVECTGTISFTPTEALFYQAFIGATATVIIGGDEPFEGLLFSHGIIVEGLGLGATAVPIPAALPLLASGLGGIGLMGWWRRRKRQHFA